MKRHILAAIILGLIATPALASNKGGGNNGGCQGNCAGDTINNTFHNQGGQGGNASATGGTGVGVGVGVGVGGQGGKGGNAHATGGNAKVGDISNRNNNANRNNNRNTNTNVLGQQQGQGQLQGQKQGQGQSQSTKNANNSKQQTNVNVEGDHYEAPDIPVATAYAPPIQPTAPCALPITGGVQLMTWGASAGTAYIVEECEKREHQRMDVESAAKLATIGMGEMAKELLCSNPEIARKAPKACGVKIADAAPAAPVKTAAVSNNICAVADRTGDTFLARRNDCN